MSFAQQFDPSVIQTLSQTLLQTTTVDLERSLNSPTLPLIQFSALLSPIASHHLETMAQKAHQLTRQRFGNTMQMFVPMYLSNKCYNTCTYCGFSIHHNYRRITLNEDEILKEGLLLKEKGFQHLLLLTGEAPDSVGLTYIKKAVELLKPHFSSIGIEVQPMKEPEYRELIQAGCDSLTLYQETYHPDSYKKHHLSGKKKNYLNRLDAADEGGKAGFYRINLGALFGLYDWRFEALSLFEHLRYMQKKYWTSKLSVSFPRIQKMVGEFAPDHELTDRDLTQLICAFRIAFPDLGITLSTREKAGFRNHVLKLGVTTMSAESHTAPGGYSGKEDSTEQFETSDHRSLEDVQSKLLALGYEPVMRDWI